MDYLNGEFTFFIEHLPRFSGRPQFPKPIYRMFIEHKTDWTAWRTSWHEGELWELLEEGFRFLAEGQFNQLKRELEGKTHEIR